tara:strand:+ start:2103 stop:3149 length:1047 start_codon:yes stop_codon:yes gene_type:complete
MRIGKAMSQRRRSQAMLTICKWMAVLLCVAATTAAYADAIVQRQSDGPIEFRLRVSDSETLIAEPLQFELEVIVPSELQVVLPALDQSLGDWEIIAKEVREDLPHADEAGPNLRRWWVRLTLETLQTGEVTIPSVEIQTLPRQLESRSENAAIDWEKAGSLVTQPISIDVVSVLSQTADPTKPEPIVGAIALPTEETPSSSSLAGVVVGVIGVLIAGALLIRRIRSRGEISNADWARRQLTDLRSQWRKQRLSPDDCARQLSPIFREWIGSMMGRESAVTSDEASAWLREVEPAIDGELLTMLTRADEVSFAGISATSSEVDSWLNRSDDWMKQLETLQVRITQEANA